jgi:hypothetical protein
VFGLDGFRFNETMSGTWTRPGATDAKAISFTVTVRARSWLQHLRDHDAELEGTLQMDGFAQNVTIRGTLHINPLLGRVIRYHFEFTADDGQRYQFRGQKDMSLTDPVGSLTILPASIEDARGQKVADCQMKFDTRHLPSFLASFRPGG